MTCTATISTKGIEFLQFFYGGGTKNEAFEAYFSALVDHMKMKYPQKRLVFLLDNLWAHKTSFIMKIVSSEFIHMLFTPTNTP